MKCMSFISSKWNPAIDLEPDQSHSRLGLLETIIRYDGCPMKPAYFDFTVKDIGKARAFFEKVFGWRFDKFPMPYDYYRIQAGDSGEPGIDGGIGAIADANVSGGHPLTQITIPVPDLDKFISKVQTAGGLVVEAKMPIPGVGWYATCAEPGGLKFGIIQADAEAK
jgi:uncharacterized protein